MRQYLRQHAPTAVSYQRYPRVRLAVHREQRVEQRLQHHLRVPDVERHAGQPRTVADASQPVELGAQRPVAREKAWNQQDRLAQAGRRVVATEDRVADETEKFEGETP